MNFNDLYWVKETKDTKKNDSVGSNSLILAGVTQDKDEASYGLPIANIS